MNLDLIGVPSTLCNPQPNGCELTTSNFSMGYVLFSTLPKHRRIQSTVVCRLFFEFFRGTIPRSLANFRETRNAENDKRRESLRGV